MIVQVPWQGEKLMSRSSDQDRLAKLQERRDQLNAQLAALEARAKQTQKKTGRPQKNFAGRSDIGRSGQSPGIKDLPGRTFARVSGAVRR